MPEPTNSTLGRYIIQAELGKGGFATVFRALDTSLNREVALKILHPQLLADRSFVERFRKEARTLASLRHAHIVTIYEVSEAEGRVFIAMELAHGSSLAQAIADRKRLPWTETLAILKPVTEALDYAHGQGVIHRDLKPANILLDNERGPLLTDFGFARLMGDSSVSMSLSGGILGTPAYIAPEVWELDTATAAVDIYALGCIAYEMVTGEVLFSGKTPMQTMRAHDRGPQFNLALPGDVPQNVAQTLQVALARQPEARYPSASALWHALNDLEANAQAAREQAERQAIADQWKAEAEAALADHDWSAAKMAVGRWLAITPEDAQAIVARSEIEKQIEQAEQEAREASRMQEAEAACKAEEERQRLAAEEKKKQEAATQVVEEARRKKQEAEEQEQQRQAAIAAQERAKREAEEKAKREAEAAVVAAQIRRGAEEKQRREAEEKAKREAEAVAVVAAGAVSQPKESRPVSTSVTPPTTTPKSKTWLYALGAVMVIAIITAIALSSENQSGLASMLIRPADTLTIETPPPTLLANIDTASPTKLPAESSGKNPTLLGINNAKTLTSNLPSLKVTLVVSGPARMSNSTPTITTTKKPVPAVHTSTPKSLPVSTITKKSSPVNTLAPSNGDMVITGFAGYVAGVLSQDSPQEYREVFVGAWRNGWLRPNHVFCVQTLSAGDGSFQLKVPYTCFKEGESVYLTSGGLNTCVSIKFQSNAQISVNLLGRWAASCP